MTGTIQNAAVQIITDMKGDALQFSFVNSSGAALSKGDEVYLHTDGSVKIRNAGTQLPIGVVIVGGANGERVTVRTSFTVCLDVANNSGGPVSAGDKLIPEGTKDSNGRPQYADAAATNIVKAIALHGAVDQAVVKVGILDGFIIAT